MNFATIFNIVCMIVTIVGSALTIYWTTQTAKRARNVERILGRRK